MNIIKSIGKLGLDLEGEEFISRGRSGIEAGLRAIVDPLPNETINPEQKIKPSTPPTPSKDRDDVQIAKNLSRQAPATPIFDEFARATKGPLVIRAMRQAIVLPTNRPRYGVAEDLQSLLHCTRNVEDIIKIQPTLSQQLRPDAYVARFRLLVQMEEYEEMINRNPIIRNITLAENLDGFGAMDIVVHCDARKFRNGQNFLFKAVHSPRRIYEGKVINARRDKGCVIFRLIPPKHGSRLPDPLEKYDMISVSKSGPWFQRLQGVIIKVYSRPVLFSVGKPSTNFKPAAYSLFDESLDREQQAAVRHMIENAAAPAPYLLLGPPGTGKTRTLVEVIRQTVFRNTWPRVLVSGFTLNAVRGLLEKVLDCVEAKTAQVVLLVSNKNELDTLPVSVKRCAMIVNGQMSETIHQRLVFSTHLTIGIVTENFSFPEGHFTHVFVDDATMLTEPECLLPLSVLGSFKDAQVILAGDICGLLPHVRSDIARELGLDCSLPLRMVNYPAYANQDPRFTTTIRKSYRSNVQLMSVSSTLLHDGMVTFNSAFEKHNSPLPTLQFVPVDGAMELRTKNGRSSYVNMAEVRAVVQQVQNFYSVGLKPEEVGVFSSAVRQLYVIKDELDKDKIALPMIGHVDDFIGEEVTALIISCVQSYPEWGKKSDEAIGFIGHPELSSFAISRARRFLTVVGNLKCLHREDLFWRFFLDAADREGHLDFEKVLKAGDS